MPVDPRFDRDDYRKGLALVEAVTDEGGLPILADMSSSAIVSGTITTLSVPGATAGINVTGYKELIYSWFVNNLDISVAIRVEGYLESTSSWFNLAEDGLDTVVYKNKRGYFRVDTKGLQQVRFNFVSEHGGTNATIAIAASAY